MFLSSVLSVLISVVLPAQADFPNPCPEVSGVYRCTGGPSDKIKVEKTDHNGFVLIRLTTAVPNQETKTISLLVDETLHPMVVDGGAAIGFVAQMKNSCSNSVLNSKMYIHNRPNEPLSLFSEVEISTPTKSKMKIETKNSQGQTTTILCQK